GVAMDGEYMQTAAGTLALRISGPLVGAEFDQMQVTGMAKLDGALGVSLLNGYVPPPGDPFPVLVAGSVDGVFSELRGEANLFELDYDPVSLTLRWMSSAPRGAARLPSSAHPALMPV